MIRAVQAVETDRKLRPSSVRKMPVWNAGEAVAEVWPPSTACVPLAKRSVEVAFAGVDS